MPFDALTSPSQPREAVESSICAFSYTHHTHSLKNSRKTNYRHLEVEEAQDEKNGDCLQNYFSCL